VAPSEGSFLTTRSAPIPIDPGLLERFLKAEQGVEWRPIISAPTPASSRKGRSGTRAKATVGPRIAYFHDESARIEARSSASGSVLTVTSGPVGALVLVTECHRRGMPTSLSARQSGELPDFPDGAIEAQWNSHARMRPYALPFGDVVKLARYALA
jgi:hypothetical protein